MRRARIVVVAAALASLLLVSTASAGKGGVDRPFQAMLTGAVTYIVPNGCPPNCQTFTTVTDAKGEVAHMGLVTMHDTHYPYDFANALDGSMTLTAANGDQLYAVYDYDLFSTSPSITVTLTGGTGRFADAAGTVEVTPHVTPQFKPMPPCDPNSDPFGCLDPDVPWPGSWSMTGMISY